MRLSAHPQWATALLPRLQPALRLIQLRRIPGKQRAWGSHHLHIWHHHMQHYPQQWPASMMEYQEATEMMSSQGILERRHALQVAVDAALAGGMSVKHIQGAEWSLQSGKFE